MMNFEKDFGTLTIIPSPNNTIEWKIDNFFLEIDKFVFEWESPTFEMCSWTWHLSMKGNIIISSKGLEGSIQVRLLNDECVNTVPLNCIFGIKTENEIKNRKALKISKDTEFLIIKLERDNLVKNKHLYSPNDNIVFSVRIYPFEDPPSMLLESLIRSEYKRLRARGRKPCIPYYPRRTFTPTSSVGSLTDEPSSTQACADSNPGGDHILLRNLRDIYNKSIYCDVTLKFGQREFNAHKSILSVSSPVFAAMFEHNMKEKNTGVVEIEDCDPDSFQEFLEYLYTTDTKKFSMERILNLYAIADKYDVKQLMEVCVQFMMDNLSIEVFCDVLQLAIKYKQLSLIKSAEEFFVKNAMQIITTVKWQSFINENGTTANELFIKTFKQHNFS